MFSSFFDAAALDAFKKYCSVHPSVTMTTVCGAGATVDLAPGIAVFEEVARVIVPQDVSTTCSGCGAWVCDVPGQPRPWGTAPRPEGCVPINCPACDVAVYCSTECMIKDREMHSADCREWRIRASPPVPSPLKNMSAWRFSPLPHVMHDIRGPTPLESVLARAERRLDKAFTPFIATLCKTAMLLQDCALSYVVAPAVCMALLPRDCEPNCTWEQQGNHIVIRTNQRIPAGTPFTISRMEPLRERVPLHLAHGCSCASCGRERKRHANDPRLFAVLCSQGDCSGTMQWDPAAPYVASACTACGRKLSDRELMKLLETYQTLFFAWDVPIPLTAVRTYATLTAQFEPDATGARLSETHVLTVSGWIAMRQTALAAHLTGAAERLRTSILKWFETTGLPHDPQAYDHPSLRLFDGGNARLTYGDTGRCLVAARDLRVGTNVFSDSALLAAPQDSRSCWYCAGAPTPGSSFSCCGKCKTVRYCGQTCQRLDWSVHRSECAMYCNKYPEEVPTSEPLPPIKAADKVFRSTDTCDGTFRLVNRFSAMVACNHNHQTQKLCALWDEEIDREKVTAHGNLQLLAYIESLRVAPLIGAGSPTSRVLRVQWAFCEFPTPSSPVSVLGFPGGQCPILASMCSRVALNAKGNTGLVLLMGSYSFCAHSCAPNCTERWGGLPARTVTLTATTRILEGEPITITYVEEECLSLCTPLRQAMLRKHWHFTCKCVKCTTNDDAAVAQARAECAAVCPTPGCSGQCMWYPDVEPHDTRCNVCGAQLPSDVLSALAVWSRSYGSDLLFNRIPGAVWNSQFRRGQNRLQNVAVYVRWLHRSHKLLIPMCSLEQQSLAEDEGYERTAYFLGLLIHVYHAANVGVRLIPEKSICDPVDRKLIKAVSRATHVQLAALVEDPARLERFLAHA